MRLPRWVTRAAGALRLLPSARTQRYRFRYRISRPPPAHAAFLLAPLPLEADWQAVADLQVDPTPLSTGVEPRHGGRYVVWQIARMPAPRLDSGGQAGLGYEATVTVRPRRLSHHPAPGVAAPGPVAADRYVQVKKEVSRIARRVVATAQTPLQVAAQLYEYVVTHLRYGHPILELYSTEQALTLPGVDCGGFVTLLAALLLDRGIPARLVSGFLAGRQGELMHAWLEAWLPGLGWTPLDPSLDHLARAGKTRRQAHFGFIGSDRVAVGLGSDLQLAVAGRAFSVPLLQHALNVPSDNQAAVVTVLATATCSGL